VPEADPRLAFLRIFFFLFRLLLTPARGTEQIVLFCFLRGAGLTQIYHASSHSRTSLFGHLIANIPLAFWYHASSAVYLIWRPRAGKNGEFCGRLLPFAFRPNCAGRTRSWCWRCSLKGGKSGNRPGSSIGSEPWRLYRPPIQQVCLLVVTRLDIKDWTPSSGNTLFWILLPFIFDSIEAQRALTSSRSLYFYFTLSLKRSCLVKMVRLELHSGCLVEPGKSAG